MVQGVTVSKKKKKKIIEERPRGPLILSLETATAVSSVAIFEEGQLLAVQDVHTNKLHAKLITVLVDQILTNLDLRPKDLAGVVVSQGPGSYTGLRVGVSAAKGLAMALQIPLLSVGSLESLAFSVIDIAKAANAWICPLLDARRMEVYCAIFDEHGTAQTEVEARIIEEGAFEEILSERKVVFLGDGAAKCKEILEKNPNAIVLEDRISSAAFSGTPAWSKFQQEDFEDLVTFEPFYLKNFVATLSKKKLL